MKNMRISIFEKIFPYLKNDKNKYILLIIFKFVFLLLSLATPYFYYLLINDVIIKRDLNILVVVIVGYIGLFLIETFFKVLNTKIYNTVFLKLKINIKLKFFKKISVMDHDDLEKYEIGDLYNRADGDINAIESFLTTHTLELVFKGLSAVVTLIILFILDWRLGVFGCIMVPLSFWFAKFMSKKAGRIANEYRERYGSYETFLHNSFQNWKDIKAYNLEEKQDEIIKNHWLVLSKLFVVKQIYWFINRGFIAFKDFFITKMNLYFLGGLFIINGSMEVAILLVFMSYYESFFSYISGLTDSIVKFKSDLPLINRVFEILDFPIKEKQKIRFERSNINISDLSYTYNSLNAFSLDDINFEVDENEHIAIIGRSGCGKTTIAKLLIGMLKPNSGIIKIDDYNIQDISYEQLNKKISIVMQDPYMLNLTIKENLLLANSKVNSSEIDLACKKANIYEFIYNLPNKYDTIIGEKGVKLSGGQRQRLAIARTFLLDPDIIIFDEATSSLDSKSEKAIIESIKLLSENKTLITITHRISSIMDADRVIILEDGKITGNGTHDEHRNNNKIYDTMLNAQYSMKIPFF